jgi:hypothetical protein
MRNNNEFKADLRRRRFNPVPGHHLSNHLKQIQKNLSTALRPFVCHAPVICAQTTESSAGFVLDGVQEALKNLFDDTNFSN